MGVVYEGVHEQLGKRVAIKTLNARLASTREMQVRFVREGEAAARIRHPNVVVVDDVGVERGIPYLVMEYFEGRDLAGLLHEKGRLDPEPTIDLLLPVVAAVKAAHEHGIVHRDLKPENIFIADTPQGLPMPKVLDFGVSKHTQRVDTQLTEAQTLLGSPYYMSPEQADSSKSVDQTSDVYSLGVILYQCLTGRLPFEGTSLMQVLTAIAAGRPRAPRSLVPNLPRELEAVILRAMSVERARRFASAQALGTALLRFSSPRIRLTYEHEFTRLTPTSPARPRQSPPAPARDASVSTLGGSARERLRSQAPPHHGGLWLLGIGLVTASVAVAWMTAPRTSRAPAGRTATATAAISAAEGYQVKLQVEPQTATIVLDGVVVGRGALARRFERDGRLHTIRLSADHYAPQTITFRDAPPPERVVLNAAQEVLPQRGPGAASEVVRPPKPGAAQPGIGDARRPRLGKARTAPPPGPGAGGPAVSPGVRPNAAETAPEHELEPHVKPAMAPPRTIDEQDPY